MSNEFGENYRGHKWFQTIADFGPAMQCRNCEMLWLPNMTANDICWCKKRPEAKPKRK